MIEHPKTTIEKLVEVENKNYKMKIHIEKTEIMRKSTEKKHLNILINCQKLGTI